MNMATLAVLTYYLISLSRTEIPLKCFLNILTGTSREYYKKQDHQKALLCKSCRSQGFRVLEFLKYIHISQTKLRATLPQHLIRGRPTKWAGNGFFGSFSELFRNNDEEDGPS